MRLGVAWASLGLEVRESAPLPHGQAAIAPQCAALKGHACALIPDVHTLPHKMQIVALVQATNLIHERLLRPLLPLLVPGEVIIQPDATTLQGGPGLRGHIFVSGCLHHHAHAPGLICMIPAHP